jgi:hypothetical protein
VSAAHCHPKRPESPPDVNESTENQSDLWLDAAGTQPRLRTDPAGVGIDTEPPDI